MTILRIATAIIAVALTFLTGLMVCTQLRTGFDAYAGACSLATAIASFLGWWFVACGQAAQSRRRMKFAISGVIVGGLVGLLGGYLGPLIWSPDSNQGPLLGIFITGPLGFVMGVIGGATYGTCQKTSGSKPKNVNS